MDFLYEPIWWMLTGGCVAIASSPAFLRSIDKTRALVILSLWLVGCTATLLRFGLLPAGVTTVISALLGMLLLGGSLVLSGIRSMPNQRFEER